MKLLYILRHGKASSSLPGGSDQDRPLVERGIHAAEAVGAECAGRGWHPARALVSPARRTQMTFECFDRAFRAAGGPSIVPTLEPALYLAGSEDVHDALAALESDVPSVVIVGHNPGLHELVVALAGAPSETLAKKASNRLARKFPTCALAAFRCDVPDWADIARHNTRLEDAIFPRDLDQS